MKTKYGSIFFAVNSETGKAPDKIQLLPSGSKILGRDGRWWNNPDPQSVVNRTNARGVDPSIDENHVTDYSYGGPAPALCWLKNLKVNEQGEVWADAEWTDNGKALVESKAYRYISPVFSFNPETKDIGEIVGAGLTNRPNLDLTALNNESQSVSQNEEEPMKKIFAALGLPEAATEEQALVALNSLQAKATNAQQVDLAIYAPRADVQAMEQRALNAEKQLTSIKDADLAKRAEIAVNAAVTGRKVAPASKTEYLAMCASEEGLARFEKIMATTPALIPETKDLGENNSSEVALNAEELAFAKSAGYSPEEWKKLKEGDKK